MQRKGEAATNSHSWKRLAILEEMKKKEKVKNRKEKVKVPELC